MRCTPSSTTSTVTDHAVEVDRHVVAVAAALQDQVGDITATMCAEIAEGIPELADPRLFDLLAASIEGNVGALLHLLRHGIPHHDVDAPPAAVEHARRLAQHEVHVKALVRAYRIGQDHLLRRSFAEIERGVGSARTAFHASQRFVSVTFAYVDRVTEQLVGVHEAERERWLDSRNSAHAERVRDLVDGRTRDVAAAERAIGYPLRRRHLGVVLWTRDAAGGAGTLARLEQFLAALGRELSCVGDPLFVARDRGTGWGWLPLGRSDGHPTRAAIEQFALDTAPDLMITLGAPAAGLAGFRDTHHQALQAQRLVHVAGACADPVTAYDDQWVRAAAILGSDLEQTRMLVRTTLGALAVDDDHRARLRETLLTFLSTSSNYTTTAQLLSMHKNSVKYRVAKAEQERGAVIEDDRFDVELALVACRWLGPAVLIPPDQHLDR